MKQINKTMKNKQKTTKMMCLKCKRLKYNRIRDNKPKVGQEIFFYLKDKI